MTQKISIDLGNVQKTLFLPLWARAVESKKEHPELVDKTAQAVLDKLKSVQDFSTWDQRLKVIGIYFYFPKINPRRGLRSILMGFLSDVLKIQYIVHLKIAAK